MDSTSIFSRLTCRPTLSPEQLLHALAYLEKAMPDSDLNYRLTPPGRPVRVADRTELVRAAFRAPDDSEINLYNSVENRIFHVGALYFSYALPEEYWQVSFEQPRDALPLNSFAPFLLGLGDLLDARHAEAFRDLTSTLNSMLNRGMGPDFAPPYGLPPVFPPETYVAAAIPQGVEWTNYWSRETAETLGFSESEHARLFYRWERGPRGSLVFQLTPEPIELDRPADIEALKAVYEAFPGLGGRDPKFRIPDDEPSVEEA